MSWWNYEFKIIQSIRVHCANNGISLTNHIPKVILNSIKTTIHYVVFKMPKVYNIINVKDIGMDKQTVAVAVVTDSGIIESIRVSADYNKLRNTVLEEMAKEFSYELTGNKAVDYAALQDISSNTDKSFNIDMCTVDDAETLGRHIVVECFPIENANICVKEEDGTTLIFDDAVSATEYAENECQDGRVLAL